MFFFLLRYTGRGIIVGFRKRSNAKPMGNTHFISIILDDPFSCFLAYNVCNLCKVKNIELE